MNRMPWIAIALLVSIPVKASADPFEDFRIPDHSWSSLVVSAQGSAARSKLSDSNQSTRNTSSAGDLTGRNFWGRDGEALQLSLDAAGRVSGSVYDHHDRQLFVSSLQLSDSRTHERRERLTEFWSVAGSMRSYPWKTPVGLELGLGAFTSFTQDWSRRRNQSRSIVPGSDTGERSGNGSETWTYHYDLNLEAAVGLGRVRDASGLLDAYVLERRLLESGALTRPLSPEARQKLAALAYVAPRYQMAHDRPDRYVWREIERILRDDGALGAEGLDAWSVLRGREGYRLLAPAGGGLVRSTGYFVGPMAMGVHQHTLARLDQTSDDRFYRGDTLQFVSTSASANRSDASVDELSLGGRAEYHRPLGWRWQLDAAGQALVPLVHAKKGLDAALDVACDYLIADRWQATAIASYQRRYLTPDGPHAAPVETYWWTRAGVSLAWFVEDRTYLSVTADETQGRGIVGPGQTRYQRSDNLRVGINYRISGRLAAPGLVQATSLGR